MSSFNIRLLFLSTLLYFVYIIHGYTLEVEDVKLYFDVGFNEVDLMPLREMSIKFRIEENDVLFEEHFNVEEVLSLAQTEDMVSS